MSGKVKKPGHNQAVKVEAIVEKPREYSLYNIWVVTTALKLLLIYAYHSTDFDVHRNWLAITSKIHMKLWYIEDTNQWTLDYPPYFAYFEWFLSLLVPDFVDDDGCLDIIETGKYGWPTIFYQRLTVVVSEIILFVSLQWYINSTPTSNTNISKKRAYVIASSLVLSPGLLIIDHIHFQYNGMMYGILILAINSARLNRYNECALWFSILLCFKHIYLYFVPAVFVYLLRAYCLNLNFNKRKLVIINILNIVRWNNLFKLASIVIAVFTIAFGPFIYYGVVPQLFARLFPFSRGLTHAYWAPNIWAIYSFLDRVLIQVYKRVPFTKTALQKICKFDPALLDVEELVNTSTRGLVGEIEFLILPNITPKLTFLLTLFYQIMALIPLFLQPNFKRFVGSLTLCGFASFLFGWHVHEKAILLVIFPMTFLITLDKRFLGPFNLLVSSGYVSLFPLIYTCDEWLIKVVYTLLWYIIFYFNFRKVVAIPKKNNGSQFGDIILDRVINGYILGLIPVISIVTLMDVFQYKFEVFQRMEFMKLMLVSVYCAVGIISSWNGFSWVYFVNDSIWE